MLLLLFYPSPLFSISLNIHKLKSFTLFSPFKSFVPWYFVLYCYSPQTTLLFDTCPFIFFFIDLSLFFLIVRVFPNSYCLSSAILLSISITPCPWSWLLNLAEIYNKYKHIGMCIKKLNESYATWVDESP